jgi:hypothetical protein
VHRSRSGIHLLRQFGERLSDRYEPAEEVRPEICRHGRRRGRRTFPRPTSARRRTPRRRLHGRLGNHQLALPGRPKPKARTYAEDQYWATGGARAQARAQGADEAGYNLLQKYPPGSRVHRRRKAGDVRHPRRAAEVTGDVGARGLGAGRGGSERTIRRGWRGWRSRQNPHRGDQDARRPQAEHPRASRPGRDGGSDPPDPGRAGLLNARVRVPRPGRPRPEQLQHGAQSLDQTNYQTELQQYNYDREKRASSCGRSSRRSAWRRWHGRRWRGPDHGRSCEESPSDVRGLPGRGRSVLAQPELDDLTASDRLDAGAKQPNHRAGATTSRSRRSVPSSNGGSRG